MEKKKKKWEGERMDKSRQEYKETEVTKAKEKAYDAQYEMLDTKEREKDL